MLNQEELVILNEVIDHEIMRLDGRIKDEYKSGIASMIFAPEFEARKRLLEKIKTKLNK